MTEPILPEAQAFRQLSDQAIELLKMLLARLAMQSSRARSATMICELETVRLVNQYGLFLEFSHVLHQNVRDDYSVRVVRSPPHGMIDRIEVVLERV